MFSKFYNLLLSLTFMYGLKRLIIDPLNLSIKLTDGGQITAIICGVIIISAVFIMSLNKRG